MGQRFIDGVLHFYFEVEHTEVPVQTSLLAAVLTSLLQRNIRAERTAGMVARFGLFLPGRSESRN